MSINDINNKNMTLTILYEFNNMFIQNNNYKETIISDDIIVKEITKDGNCFYNAISYYFHMIEEYNKNYRASYIIYTYIQLMKSKNFLIQNITTKI